MRFAVALLFLAASASAQAPAQQPPGGVAPAWELKKQLDGLVAQVRRMMPLLDQVRPQEWGADGYREQHKGAKSEVEYLAHSAAALAKEPERMTLALEAFLRLEALEQMLESLSQGVRKYQNPALADLIQGSISENSVYRSRLRSYLTELVATKQDELRMANEEAQNCRAAALAKPISKKPNRPLAPPPPAPTASNGSNPQQPKKP
jgi:hypothetical protein